MIISHKYKYLFVELPRTGSTAISKELREQYDGQAILHKHATYDAFERIATPEEKNYFVFSGIRNPLDDAVSYYFKMKTDHKGQYSAMATNKKWLNRLIWHSTISRYHYIRKTNADFSTYFLKFYTLPFNNWSTLSHDKFDAVIRFENLSEDFVRTLELIGIQPKRSLPAVNKTGKKSRDPISYYTPEAAERAKKVFGPFMECWGYNFPAAWGPVSLSPLDRLKFRILNVFRNFYWKHLRIHVHNRLSSKKNKKLLGVNQQNSPNIESS